MQQLTHPVFKTITVEPVTYALWCRFINAGGMTCEV